MKVRLELFTVDDAVASKFPGIDKDQAWYWKVTSSDLPISDGPSCSRINVRTLDDEREEIEVTRWNERLEQFEPHERRGYDQEHLRALSVFTTALKTLALFEHRDALGRRLSWNGKADETQLQIFLNQPTDRSAEFGSDDQIGPYMKFSVKVLQNGSFIDTALSSDIVAHETTHAIIDAIAPRLLNAVEPESRAIHEAIADLASMLTSLQMNNLRNTLLEKDPDLRNNPQVFGQIAEILGSMNDADHSSLSQASKEASGLRSLRNLYTGKTYLPNQPNSTRPGGSYYDSSLVLSSAIFGAMLDEYDYLRNALDRSSGYCLYVASSKIRRSLLRGLDYLPETDTVSFVDLGRAMILADELGYPEEKDNSFRDILAKQFASKGIGSDASLRYRPSLPTLDFTGVNKVQELVGNEAELEKFVENNRSAFSLPNDITFKVLSRAQDKYYPGGAPNERDEIVIKVSWVGSRKVLTRPGFKLKRTVWLGTSIVICPKTKKAVLKLTTERSADPEKSLDPAVREQVWDKELDQLENSSAGIGADHITTFEDGSFAFRNMSALLHKK